MPNFSGVWNLKEQIQAIAAGRWTGCLRTELYAWGNNTPASSATARSVNRPALFKLEHLTIGRQVFTSQDSTRAAVKTKRNPLDLGLWRLRASLASGTTG
jgi:hypothetical protein